MCLNVLFCADGIISADGAISPVFYADFQNGDLGPSGYMSRYCCSTDS